MTAAAKKITGKQLLMTLSLVVGVLLLILSARVISSKSQFIQISEPTLITLEKGDSFYTLCKSFMAKKYITDCFGHKLQNKLFAKPLNLKSGTYQITGEMTLEQAVERFRKGDEFQFSFTLLEGENIYQVLQKVQQEPRLVNDIKGLSLQALAQRLVLEADHPEGMFYPDTYFFTDQTPVSELLKRAAARQQKLLQQLWAERPENSYIQTPYEALILASIIEKESAHLSEKGTISSVFYNRLAKGMRLQTDPTVIYGVWDEYRGDITRNHLKQKTPYNTYRINGLPPTPIANPSISSIKAALNPASTEYYYFVADGEGAHTFSRTLKEHNIALKRYLEKTRS